MKKSCANLVDVWYNGYLMIELTYVPVTFKISFEREIEPKQNPLLPFVLRSVLGYNLRSMSCISRKNLCPECMYNKTCAYSYIFETIIPQENGIHLGTNRASHPYAFSDFKYIYSNNSCSEAEFTITLFGDAVKFFPYIYAAFARAGRFGLFKDRIGYTIDDVIINGDSVLVDENNVDTNFCVLGWKYSNSEDNSSAQDNHNSVYKKILIELKMPLRFKSNGKYTDSFSAQDFMNCLFRRLKTLCMLYGSFSGDFLTDGKYYASSDLAIVERNLEWLDYSHYSARQKKSMELGGFVGTLKMQGTFSEFDLALFDFAQKFNAGKNTNFGLGKIDYWIK